jgi:hypothetical protein
MSMNEPLPDDSRATTFLTRDAGPAELLTACIDNHVELMRRIGRASGGTVAHNHGLDWIHAPRPVGSVTVAVTRPPAPEVRAHIDELVQFCRDHAVETLSYWACAETLRSPLGTWLGARGFRWGSRPHWMGLDVRDVGDMALLRQQADTINVSTPDRLTGWDVPELPCLDPREALIREAMIAERPRRYWQALMWSDGRPVGQMSFHLTTGELGVCGLHDTVVVASERTAGPGLVRFAWPLRFAAEKGCRYLVTNAAQERASLYKMAGFRSLGFGQTWWLPQKAIEAPTGPDHVAYAEAIGDGDVDQLESLTARLGARALDRPLSSGMTPLQFAARTESATAAQWLLDRGATPDLLAAWDLGWREQAQHLGRTRPDLVRVRRPRSGKTLLHIAVERNDHDLVRWLLDAGVDVDARDVQFDATALDWATELRRPMLAASIRAHSPSPS